jgi:hypothetical protein
MPAEARRTVNLSDRPVNGRDRQTLFKRLTSGRMFLRAPRIALGRIALGRNALATLSLLTIALTAGGCATDGRMNSLAQAPGANTTLTFDSIDGPPPQVFERFVEALNAEAQAKALPIVSREGTATYRVRAYLAAQITRGRTTIAWTFDVYEAGQQRALRLTGEEPAGKAGRDAWTMADAQLLRRIAQNGMAGVAQLMNGTLPSEPPGQVVPSRGPAVAEAEEAPTAASRTTLAFRRE